MTSFGWLPRRGLGVASLPFKALTVLILGLGSCFILLTLLLSFANLSTLLDLSAKASRKQTIIVAGQLGRDWGQGTRSEFERIVGEVGTMTGTRN